MTRKDASRRQSKNSPSRGRKLWVTMLLVGMIASGLFFAAQQMFGPDSAIAQTRPAAPQNTANSAPSSNPANNAPTGNVAVLAVVNREPISRQQLAQECARRYGEVVLESLVNKHLIIAACEQKGIVITQQDIDQEIERIAAKWGLSIDRWVQLLKEERDITPQQYGRDIVWPTLALRALAANNLQITDDEVDRMLISDLGPKVQVRMIVMNSKEEADRVYLDAIAKPESFPKLAQTHSKDTNSASVGGLILPIRRHVGDPTVERIAFGLQVGGISPVFHAGNQYIILRCEKHLPGDKISPSQEQAARTRIVDHLREKKLAKVADGLFKQLQDSADIQNVYNNQEFQTRWPGVAATIIGQQISLRQLYEECIVRHGQEVLDGEINRKLLEQALTAKRISIDKADLDREVARAAEAYGFQTDGQPDIDKWLKNVTEQEGVTAELYVRDAVWPTVALKQLVGDSVQVTKEDLDKGWDANYGPRVQVLAIVMDNHRNANKVWGMAKGNPTEEFFGELAEQHSIEPVSRANGGHVPPIQKFGGRPTLEEIAFQMQPGEISGLINVDNKWIILYCLGRTEPVVSDRNAVGDELYKDIFEKKLRLAMSQEFDRLRETAQIDNFLAGTSQSGQSTNVAELRDAPMNSRIPFSRN